MSTVSCHPHPLQFVSNNDPSGWACDARNIGGCRRGITDYHQTMGVPRYRCNGCDFDLCDVCIQAYGVGGAQQSPQSGAIPNEWEIDRDLASIQNKQDLERFLSTSGLSEPEKQQVRQEWDRNGRGTEAGGTERGVGTWLLGGAVAVGGIFLLKKLLISRPQHSSAPQPGGYSAPPPAYGSPSYGTPSPSPYGQPTYGQPNQSYGGGYGQPPAQNPQYGQQTLQLQPRDLKIVLVRCNNLKDTDTFGKSDPYVVLEVHGQRQISSCKNNDLNPVYNETFLFRNVDQHQKLDITVKDKDVMSDDKVGHGSLKVSDVPRGQEREFTISLGHHGIMFHKATCTLRATYI